MLTIDAVYIITIGDYPWTDAYAQTNSTLSSTLLSEDQARQFLDGQKIKITNPIPIENANYQGDKGMTCNWVRGTLISGPLVKGEIMTIENWLHLAPNANPNSSSCSCPINTLMLQGCQCGQLE